MDDHYGGHYDLKQREALIAALTAERIPYTPEQLVEISRRELAWCREEMQKAAAEMGFADWREALEAAVRLSAPMMPHLAEELWAMLRPGEAALVAELPWLEADPALLTAETVTLAVQVLGKLRATIEVPAGADEAAVLAQAEAEENVRRAIGDRPIRKRIHVPGRVVNFVV